MPVGDNLEKTKPKKRLSLNDIKSTRASLCKFMRAYYNGAIDHATFRNTVYSFNALLGQDKHINEIDVNKRIDALERLVKGEGETVIDSKELNSPYALDLKKQLKEMEIQKRNTELKLLLVETELKQIKAEAVNE